MKKIILLIMLLIPFKVLAVETSAKSSILIEQSTGTILSEEESHSRLPMASMTKMMTLLIVMENIEKGNIKLDDMVPISESAASMGGSQIYLSANTTMKLDTLIKAICIASANDATYAVAEYIAGTHDGFVKLMNEKVKELGLKDTNFENVHGLDSDNHYSSAYDMAFIARELLNHPKILEYSSIYEDYANMEPVARGKTIFRYRPARGPSEKQNRPLGRSIRQDGVAQRAARFRKLFDSRSCF